MRLLDRQISAQDLSNLVNHIVLPPKLPQKSDQDPTTIEQNLLDLVQDAHETCTTWSTVTTMLSKIGKAHKMDSLDRDEISSQISSLSPGDSIAFRIASQNAGLLIRHADKHAVFESFELSATSESVVSTSGRSLRKFPGRAVACPIETFADYKFQHELSKTLCQLNNESVSAYEPTSKKAGERRQEERDTTHPGLVSDYLMTMLSALGTNHHVSTTPKHIRDDVLWSDALLPWRRAPFWLFMRVSMIRTLTACLPLDKARKRYKWLMIQIVARLLDLASESQASPEILSATHVKLARRVSKFEKEYGLPNASRLLTISKRARKILDTTWSLEVAKDETVRKLPTVGWESSTNLLLPKARKALHQAVATLKASASSSTFHPSAQLRLVSDTLPSLPSQSSALDESTVFMLAEFEFWIENNLTKWTESTLKNLEAKPFDDLTKLVAEYWSLASSHYADSPLEKSNALLVVIELWVALDKICVARLPLLRRYSPEISADVLSPLLLPKINQMRRLSKVEKYIRERISRADQGDTSIFAKPCASSFSVWYYNISPSLQELRQQIERQDQQKRDEKLSELETSTKKYEDLIARSNELTHTERLNRRNRLYHDVGRCLKCSLEKQAKAMRIKVDEKSLPEDIVQLKAVVFELAVPVAFAAWRDTTWFIIQDIGQRKSLQGASMYALAVTYNQLLPFVEHKTRQPNLTLGSTSKTFLQAHYKDMSFPTTKKKICVNNALQYNNWSQAGSGNYLTNVQGKTTFKEHCILSLPPGPYSNLQWALRSSDHTSNEVMARQNSCSDHLEIREYIAFCSLRAGERLQWLNVLRELGCCNLSANEPAVTTLVLQAIWEAGQPSYRSRRVAHGVLCDSLFCGKLLNILRQRLASIVSNWQEQQSMMTLVQLVLRVLSLTSNSTTETDCLKILKKARKVCLEWCRQIQEHMCHNSTQRDVQDKGSMQVLGAALLCYSTFDVDEKHVPSVLATDNNIAMLAEAQMVVCDTTPVDHQVIPLLLRQALLHHAKIAHRLEPHVRSRSVIDGTGLNQAVQNIWNGAILDAQWHTDYGDARSWLCNKTVTAHGRSQTVHFNLLGGILLVDGKPIGKIPNDIKSQQLFQQIFGPAVLNVFSSHILGMDYTVSQHVHGNEVHIGSRDGRILIRARFENRMLQALPQETFAEQIPSYFVRSFTHWLDESSGVVEFRPLENPWQSSEDNWKLSFSDLDFLKGGCQLRLGDTRVIEPKSSVGECVTSILHKLDATKYCEITLDDTHPSELKVYLRRYNLHFHITADGKLFSLEYNAVVDLDQSLGTMIGLKNKLVLADASFAEGIRERRVIIPYGKVETAKTGSHVSVSIKYDTEDKQKYFVYSLDRHLHKLRGQQDILGTLHKAYLHAVTSFLLPDPFTGRTGTEEAISTLKEASLFSCQPLSEEEAYALNLIAGLTPHRTYYPLHKKVMQTVRWNPCLPAFSQHDDFFLAASAIFNHHSRTNLLFSSETTRPELALKPRGDETLLRRAKNHNVSVVKSGFFSDVKLSQADDTVYFGRDRLVQNDKALRVFEIASLVKEWPCRIATHKSLVEVIRAWNRISSYNSGPFEVTHLEQLSTLKFNQHFGSLYELCRHASRNQMTFSLMFRFCAIAIGADAEALLHVRTLLAFAFSGLFRDYNPPHSEFSYLLSEGSSPSDESIQAAINRNLVENILPVSPEQSHIDTFERKEREAKEETQKLHQQIVAQWPHKTINIVESDYTHINTSPVRVECQALFDMWHKNRIFLIHIKDVDTKLATIQTQHVEYSMAIENVIDLLRGLRVPFPPRNPRASFPRTLEQLLKDNERAPLQTREDQKALLALHPMRSSTNASLIKRLVNVLSQHRDPTHKEYAKNLCASVQALEGQYFDLESQPVPLDGREFENHQACMAIRVAAALESIHQILAPVSDAQTLLDDADLWPRLTVQCLLAQLSKAKVSQLPARWKHSILQLGENMASLQRSERIMKFHQAADRRNLWKELKHPGREGWTVTEYPTWLLLEIENNITIRPNQAKVAKSMMLPASGNNSVLQLNMGEGKSSVIVPMLVTALADGKRLVRVIVLKPLLRQTEQVLTQRLGGMIDQRIGYVPFSRKSGVTSLTVDTMSDTFKKYTQESGVMVALPEEMLSMRLMTREKMTSDRVLATKVLNLQRWLESRTRDILDGSDEILSVRSQLIYPVGCQQMLDGKNDRWIIQQAVLQRVNYHAKILAASHPSELELEYGGKSFPLLKFLCPSVSERFVNLLVDDAIQGRIAGVSFGFYSEETRAAAKNYISCRQISQQDVSTLTASVQKGPHWKALLILRGLFAHEVLQFALSRKRWLVEYGLSDRCLMAVPYRAKGVPSMNSEFGHPDVGILLTCLSYYYTGLTIEQMYACFKILSKDSNPEDVYGNWVAGHTKLQKSLRSFEAVNLDDRRLCEEDLYPQMRFNLEIITFYLNHVVFPKEGKEFAKRISASGWDIPSASQSIDLVTTGFSGTNDSRAVLPFTIKQEDLAEMHHTNAMVLNLLLRHENKTYLQSVDGNGKKLEIAGLLELMSRQSPRVNVLIDVGAQILEATNSQLVAQWLRLRNDASAAVFFDDQDEAMVLDRSGAITPLRISPFQGKLDACLIYLDEVHTRGIDLAIPTGAKAAVTLGPRLVKDRLMQACMRMRSLGNGHSLCFIAPPEVHRSIIDVRGATSTHEITSFDVLAWSMEQTCQALDIARPLRVMHGLEHLRQQRILHEFLPATSNPELLARYEERMQKFWREIQEDDAHGLEFLYGVNDERIGTMQALLDRGSSNLTMQHLVQESTTMSKDMLEDSSMDNEQERELEHEIERERQVQRPPQAKPLIPAISKSLLDYVRSGAPEHLSLCDTENVFKVFMSTTARDSASQQYMKPDIFKVLATKDFIRSVGLPKRSLLDDYLRPVAWILSSRHTELLLIISPHEANELLPDIKASEQVRLHTFAPRTSKKMPRFDRMDFYTPSAKRSDPAPSAAAIRDLELFAGSLYYNNLSRYHQLVHYLGIATASTRPRNRPIHADGFVDSEIRAEMGWPENCPFARSPLPFLKQVLSLRLHGQDFSHSHMGALLNGRVLQESAFEGCEEREVTIEEMENDDG